MIFSSVVSAQDVGEEYYFGEEEPKVRSFRIGGKLGFPNLIGGNLEYVTPLLNHKLSVSVDYSTLKSDWLLSEEASEEEYEDDYEDPDNSKLDFAYMEGGLNYYLFSPGRGLYVGASYSNIKVKGQLMVYSQDPNREEPGTGYIDSSHSSFNVKLGAKLGGLFYFRPEVGYSFSSFPETYETRVVYDDGYTETRNTQTFDPDASPGNLIMKGLIANIGLGFAF